MGGGDKSFSCSSSPEGKLSKERDFPGFSLKVPTFIRGRDLSGEVESDTVDGDEQLVFDDLVRPVFSDSAYNYALQTGRKNVFKDILRSFDDLRVRSECLEEARSKILSYSPGSWIENAGGMKLSNYNVPTTTSLILIGPKGSGKSSLVNQISSVFEDDTFASERAQVSHNNSAGDGTYFLREYMIPRSSTSFCLYDTRSLSDDSSENIEMVKSWMTRGVRHGEVVFRNSDSSSIRTLMKSKARQSWYCSSEIRMVNFVIFVVDGLSVLKSMDSTDEAAANYFRIVASTFNSPYLSFKDDKPVVVVTHGDLLSLSDRARVRFWLGELLGIPPTKQIFDIPETYDRATKLSIVDMLRYSLEHADRNLPYKNRIVDKVYMFPPRVCLILLLVLVTVVLSAYLRRSATAHPKYHRQWDTMRHLWFDMD